MEVELQSSSYGSVDDSKPLHAQKNYTNSIQYQPLSEVKYESLNEIHLDFSKAKPFQGGIRSNSNSNITTTTLTKSPKRSSTNLNDMNFSDKPSITSYPSTTTLTNKNNLNSIRSNSSASNGTMNSSLTYIPSNLHTTPIENQNDNINSDISLKSRMKRTSGQNVYIDTKLKNDSNNDNVVYSANTTFTAVPNVNSAPNTNSEKTPSTEETLDSPLFFRSFEHTQTPISYSKPTPTETPKTANTSFSAIQLFKSVLSPVIKKQDEISIINQKKLEYTNESHQNSENDTKSTSVSETVDTEANFEKSRSASQNFTSISSSASSYNSKTPTFKSFQNFDHLKDQLEKSAKGHHDLEQEEATEYSRDKMIRNQFSEQYREEYNKVKSSPFKKGNSYYFPIGKDDPFNPYHDSNYPPSKALEDSNDSFLTSMNNQPHFDKVQDFDNTNHPFNSKKIDWQLKTDSEKYVSRLESKMNKVKRAPKEIVVEIPEYEDDEYGYNSLVDEESELLSDNDSINQPLIRRSEAGTRIRRRKRIMYIIKDNKKLIISLILILFIALSLILL
ncbi:hypothetical protein H8356DRAFT_1627243 [Neocallimastix lanati (nom. inval.)]|jgi:hypothetical protein|uniref:Uncharacterized protein n=1 Tax=Neocallimastix californiae TaxID=1754190 RepID=A0A1Y1YUF8_9FUNG|nr:hypothetical protein H8356DRAFT_1627243 [Neocallimastix sp. JGI-2020a]ORY01367.1 hypothetical protein LY90DRAFT_678665 [Neocallimastix californiae]|eukprot:ORY01367.1 hypothetical protein LY90DRAFT_678665 [Neocallimastix californiae]